MQKEQYKKELVHLKEMKKLVMKSLEGAPRGRIRSELSKGKYPQYYYIEENEVNVRGKYLSKKEISVARACVQREYDMRILEEISKREDELQRIIDFREESEIRYIYDKFPVAKRLLLTPYVLSDEEYVRQWMERKAVSENTISHEKSFFTERGEEVRSKSEKIIADKLYIRKIPYKYEAALSIGGKKLIFPDFTVLNVRTRQEVYYEHFGVMDNPEYCRKALEKIELYENNGYLLGEKLFVSFESSLKPINLSQLDLLINRMTGNG